MPWLVSSTGDPCNIVTNPVEVMALSTARAHVADGHSVALSPFEPSPKNSAVLMARHVALLRAFEIDEYNLRDARARERGPELAQLLRRFLGQGDDKTLIEEVQDTLAEIDQPEGR